jgi:hypothetical protein
LTLSADQFGAHRQQTLPFLSVHFNIKDHVAVDMFVELWHNIVVDEFERW